MNNLTLEESLYIYKAYVTKVYDGDTITCIVDCGFHIGMQKTKIRLYGINTPELRGDDKEIGVFVRDELRNKILNKNIILKTIKDKKGKYGRYLGIIYVLNEDKTQDKSEDTYLCINDWLLEMNYASVYK
jgi:micrococcal nuclease